MATWKIVVIIAAVMWDVAVMLALTTFLHDTERQVAAVLVLVVGPLAAMVTAMAWTWFWNAYPTRAVVAGGVAGGLWVTVAESVVRVLG